MPMRTLTLTNQKGGVGKSAVATMLAHYLRSLGHRVLCIDLDHQGNFSQPLELSGKCIVSETTADRVLTDPDAMVEEADMVLLPATGDELQELERQPARYNEFAGNLRRFLVRAGAHFDFAIIDTNPTPDIRVLAALVASDYVLAPITLTQEAINGLANLFNHPRVGISMLVQRGYNRRLRFLGMLPMMVEPTPFQRENLLLLMGEPAYRAQMLALVDDPQSGADYARIKRSVVVQEAQATGQALPSMRKTAAREAWAEIKPVMHRIAQLMGAA